MFADFTGRYYCPISHPCWIGYLPQILGCHHHHIQNVCFVAATNNDINNEQTQKKITDGSCRHVEDDQTEDPKHMEEQDAYGHISEVMRFSPTN